jgi:hypothetical protein
MSSEINQHVPRTVVDDYVAEDAGVCSISVMGPTEAKNSSETSSDVYHIACYCIEEDGGLLKKK